MAVPDLRRHWPWAVAGLGLAMLIAGAVMLGIGIHKASQNNDHKTDNNGTANNVHATPYFFSLQKTDITYDQAENDYVGTVKQLKDQILAVIATKTRDAKATPTVTILGISQSTVGIDVIGSSVYSFSAPSQDQFADSLKEVPNSGLHQTYGASGPTSIQQQVCSKVNPYTPPTTTSPAPVQTTNTNTLGPSPPGTSPVTPGKSSASGTPTTAPSVPPTTSSGSPSSSTVPVATTTVKPTPSPSSTATTSSAPVQPTTTTTSKQTSASPTTTLPTTTYNPPVTTPCTAPTNTPTVSPTAPVSPNVRDVVLLIDNSNSIGGKDSYAQLKQFVVSQLVSKWNISEDGWMAASAEYDAKTFNVFDYFDVYSTSEFVSLLNDSMTYEGRYGSGITRALRAVNPFHSYKRNAPRTTILITTSNDGTDIALAKSYADKLKENVNDYLITVAVGPHVDASAISALSSGEGFFFYSPSMGGYANMGADVTKAVAGGYSPPSTCNPDIQLLFDTSRAVGSVAEMKKQVQFFIDILSLGAWTISLEQTEISGLLYSKETIYELPNSFQFKSNGDAITTLQYYQEDYYAASPNITSAIEYLITDGKLKQERRPNHPYVQILVTYTSSYLDVLTAQPLVSKLGGNLIILGVGNVQKEILQELSGNVIVTNTYDSTIIDQVNSMLCSPVPPVTFSPPTTAPTTQPAKPTTTAPFTYTTHSTPSPTPFHCPDCVPSESNILILIDASNRLDGDQYSEVIRFITNELLSKWTHFERTAFAVYSDKAHFEKLVGFGDLQSYNEAALILNNTRQNNVELDLPNALKQGYNQFNRLTQFGIQHTVLFVATPFRDEVQDSMKYADQLKTLGPLTVVGVNVPSIRDFSILASVGDAIAWKDTSDTSGLADQIEHTLDNLPPTTTSQPTTIPSTTTGPTTVPTKTSPIVGSTTSGHSGSPTTTVQPSPTPSVGPLGCSKGVLLLVDESNAVPDDASFNQFKSWLKTLVGQWPSDVEIALAGYAGDLYDGITDFDVANISPLIDQALHRQTNIGGKVTKALHAATQYKPPHHQEMITLLITATSDQNDMSRALSYALQLQTNGNTLITLSLGKADASILASSPTFAFKSAAFGPSVDLATHITNTLCKAGPTHAPTTVIPTTQPITPKPDYIPCSPDVAVLIDSSRAVPNLATFTSQVEYIANNLPLKWNIGPNYTEVGAFVYTEELASSVYNSFTYSDYADFQKTIDSYSTDYYQGTPSISAGLNFVSNHLNHRRPGTTLTTILFTFSSDYDDISNALPSVSTLGGNLIVIGVGKGVNQQNLNAISSDVFVTTTFDDALTNYINKHICDTPTSPGTLPPRPQTTTTPVPQPTTTTPFVPPTHTTTSSPTPVCPDCKPIYGHIVIVLDASSSIGTYNYDQQIACVNELTKDWNHFERVAIAAYADKDADYQVIADYGDIHNTADVLAELKSVVKFQKPANLTSGFKKTFTDYLPSAKVAPQKVVFFTSTWDATDISGATFYAKHLTVYGGSVTVVGIGATSTTAFEVLASPGDAIAWTNIDDLTTVAQEVDDTLNRPPSTGTTVVPSTTTQSHTVTTTMKPTPHPSVCSRKVLLLFDASSALGSEGNFNDVRSFITDKLLPEWDLNKLSVSVGFFGSSLQMLDDYGDFHDLASLQKLITMASYYERLQIPSLTKTLHQAIASLQIDVSIILITASGANQDVQTAIPYANQLKSNANTFTVVALGTFDKQYVKQLATSPDFVITHTDYNLDASLADSVTATICKQAPTTTPAPTTTTVAPPTTTFPSPFSCNPDVVLMFDNSVDVGADHYTQMLDFASQLLVPTWDINFNRTETMALLYCKGYGITIGSVFDYGSSADFAALLSDYRDDYFGGDPSIAEGLDFAVTLSKYHRSGHPYTTVMFTFTSDYDDVSNAISILPKLQGEIIIVALGKDAHIDYLKALSENVIPAGTNFNQDLVNKINGLICGGQPGHETLPPLVTTQKPTSPAVTTQTPPAITTQKPTPHPVTPCKDCNPPGNILVLIDASNGNSDANFKQQIAAVKELAKKWNHFERVALAAYSSSAHFSQIFDYEGIISIDEFNIMLNTIVRNPNDVPDIISAFKKADSSFSVPKYGPQKTIFFASKLDPTKVPAALSFALDLQSKGSVTLVGIGMKTIDVVAQQLASPAYSLAWEDVGDNIYEIADRIENTLDHLPVTTSPQPKTTVTTTVGPTTVKPSVGPLGCSKGVLLLVDESNAIPDDASFNQFKSWLKTLVGQWPSDVEIALAGYAGDLFDGITDFDVANISPLIDQALHRQTNIGGKVTKALHAATQYKPPHHQEMITLLITATSDQNDMSRALSYALQLQTNGNTLITLSLGKADASILVSSPTFAFKSAAFGPSVDLATQITNTLCKAGPTHAPTTVIPTTQPITPKPDYIPCSPDVAVLIDSSRAVPNLATFTSQVEYIANNLPLKWNIGPNYTEVGAFVYTEELASSVYNSFTYSDYADFQKTIDSYSTDYYQGTPSISAGLNFVSNHLNHRRPGTTLTTILFTFSSDYDDISNALPSVSTLGGNLIVIGVGKGVNQQNLNALSSDVLVTNTFDDALTNYINKHICDTPTSPGTLPPRPQTTTTPVPQPTTTTPFVPPTHTTTSSPTPVCPDCKPIYGHIVIVLDASSSIGTSNFELQKECVAELTKNWNHFERVAIAAYADKDADYQVIADYGDIHSKDDFLAFMSHVGYFGRAASLTSAFKKTVAIFAPSGSVAPQKVVLFTASWVPKDVHDATAYAQRLNSFGGSVTVIGVQAKSTTAFASLASPGDAIAWENTDVFVTVAQEIESILDKPAPTGAPPTAPVTIPTVTSPLPPGTGCKTAVVLLFDSSSAVQSADNFNQIKQWVMNSLVSKWNMDKMKVAVATFADSIQMISDFDAKNIDELKTLINAMALPNLKQTPSLRKALLTASQLDLPKGYPVATILVTASADPTDVARATPYAALLKERGPLVTVSLGPGDFVPLKWIATSSDYALSSATFNPGEGISAKITTDLCAPLPTFLPTTQAPTTIGPTEPVATAAIPCQVDVAVLIDNSVATGERANLKATVDFLADNLVSTWSLGDDMQAEAIFYAEDNIQQVPYWWAYKSTSQFQHYLKGYDILYPFNNASMTSGLLALEESLINRQHQDRLLTVLLFTNSSAYEDIQSAQVVLDRIGPVGDKLNLIVIGNGPNIEGNWLRSLTGNVINAEGYNHVLVAWLNNAICIPKAPHVTLAPLSTVQTTQQTTTTRAPFTLPTQITIKPTAQPCPDCIPSSGNVVFLLDNSNTLSQSNIDSLTTFVRTIYYNFNHFERFALATYSDRLNIVADYGSLRTQKDFDAATYLVYKTKATANITSALRHMSGLEPSLPIQRVVLFAATYDANDILTATQYAKALQSLGSVTVVPMGMKSTNGLEALASPGDTVLWETYGNTLGVAQKIRDSLSPDVHHSSTPQASTKSPTPAPPTPSLVPTTTSTAPDPCPNCYPATGQILFLIDTSGKDASKMKAQTDLIDKMTSQWNHFDRIAVGIYADQRTFIPLGFFGDMQNHDDLIGLLQAAFLTNKPANLTSSLQKSISTFKTIPQYGNILRTVVFATTYSKEDITTAAVFAKQLQDEGSVTVVLAGMTDTQDFSSIGSTGDVIAWNDLKVDSTIIDSIDKTLGASPSTNPPSVKPSLAPTHSPIIDFPKGPLIIAIDASNGLTNKEFEREKHLVGELTANWKNMLQTGYLFYSSKNNQQAQMDIGNIQTHDEMVRYFNGVGTVFASESSIEMALKLVSTEFTTDSKPTVLLFTTQNNEADVIAAKKYTSNIQRLTIVSFMGAAVTDYSSLTNSFISWTDMNDTTHLIEEIMKQIGPQ